VLSGPTSFITSNPKTILVILIILFIFAMAGIIGVCKILWSWFWGPSTETKSPFYISPINNQTTGNAFPLWWYGGMHAGKGGSMERGSTKLQQAMWNPALRGGYTINGNNMKEGFGEPNCAANEVVKYQYDPENGKSIGYCAPMVPSDENYNSDWTPTAIQQAQVASELNLMDAYKMKVGGIRQAANSQNHRTNNPGNIPPKLANKFYTSEYYDRLGEKAP